jgi:hypothetical protein
MNKITPADISNPQELIARGPSDHQCCRDARLDAPAAKPLAPTTNTFRDLSFPKI